MKEYQKIETLYKFDSAKKGFTSEFYNPIVAYLKDLPWYGTEKIDGTNIRVLWNGHTFTFSGRTDDSVLPLEVKALLESTFDYNMEVSIEQKFGEKEVMFFMEAYGGKVQNGTYSGNERLIGFDISIGGIYLDKLVSQQIFTQLFLPFVPITYYETLSEAIAYVKTNPMSKVDPTAHIEGLVCVPQMRIYDHMGNRIIVKIKVKDLNKLLKGE